MRVADVGAVTLKRWEQVPINAVLQGSPEMVIEVLPPSNTVAEMNDCGRLCLETGCLEFWGVDPKQRQVKVSRPDGNTHTYTASKEIPLALFGAAALPASEIFP